MKNTILVDTHRSGVIEIDLKKFEFYYSFFSPFPEYDKFKYETIMSTEKDYEWSYNSMVKKRRREFAKTDEFRSIPIENTDDNWWRDSYSKEKRQPRGRRQQMSQYLIDLKYNNLSISKPDIWSGFHRYEDPVYCNKEQKTWKTDKKVKKQWMKHKNKKIENCQFASITDFTLFNELYQEAITDLFFGIDLEKYPVSEFEETYKEEIEKEILNERITV